MYLTNSLYLTDLDTISSLNISFLKEKKILITGASGLIGSFLVDFLVYLNLFKNTNIQIYPVFSSEKSYTNRFGSYTYTDFLRPLIHDITIPFKLNFSPDFIVHAAGHAHPKLYITNPVETFDINFIGTKNILELQKGQGSKSIFLSSFEVYGNNQQEINLEENSLGLIDFNRIRSCYPLSKVASENLCKCFVYEYDSDISILRLGYIYGPTVNLNSSKADVQFLNNALIGKDIILLSTGSQKRSYCYVADAISAILCLLEKGGKGESYNLSVPDGNITLRDFASILAEISDVNVICKNKESIMDYQNAIMSSDKIKKIGWRSLFTTKEGISHTFYIKKFFMQKE